MSPIELLKSGIETGDWQQVCASYHALTGQSLPAPTQTLGPKQVATMIRNQLLAAVDQILGELVIGPTSKPTPAPKAKEPVIVVPTPEEAEALLATEDEARIECVSEDGLGIVEPDQDSITKADINGEGPTEPLKEIVATGTKNCFGDTMKFITRAGPPDPAMIRTNQIRAQRAAARKQPRPEPTKYEAVCSDCQRAFESLRKPSHGIGQKCPRCIRKMEKPER